MYQSRILGIALSSALLFILMGCSTLKSEAKPVEEKISVSDNGMPNPIKQATLEDFENMGITLQLPDNDNWIIEPSYSIIDSEVAQVKYTDGIIQADMMLRIGKQDIENMAGIYYPFDNSREEYWSAFTHTNHEEIKIRVQYAISDGKQTGVLASWNDSKFQYTLWGDVKDIETDISSIAKTAVYIAERRK